MSTKEDAERLIEAGSTVFLVTIRDDGRPNARTMATIKCEGLKTIWMLTGKDGDKYRELSRNPRCLLYATDLEYSKSYLELRLWGDMEIFDDAASRARNWRENYRCFFPGGKDDPNLCVLKFTAASGTLQTMAGKETFAL